MFKSQSLRASSSKRVAYSDGKCCYYYDLYNSLFTASETDDSFVFHAGCGNFG